MNKDYEVIIGLEVHAELSTKTKAYCSCTTEFGSDPNLHCCPICTGMPGTLPVLNEKVVEYAVMAGLATNCEISKFSKQDRKNYFYPDLPKAYQISQYDLPLCKNGYIDATLEEDGKSITKRFGITRIHIEEDAGKLIHDAYTNDTLVDLNRCSVPLIEIVSEPDMRSAEDAVAYMQTLKSILEYLEICDCKMQEGSLRCDVNLSVRKKGDTKFGTRTETKNLNSFKAIEKTINSEIKRQINVIENGGSIIQETRRYDDATQTTVSMRTKENSNDYRYFPEPDLVPIVLTDEYINNIKNNLPELPNVRKQRYINEYNLSEYDANILTSSKEVAKYFEDTLKYTDNAKAVANYIMVDFFKLLNENEITISNSKITPENLDSLIKLIDSNVISSKIAKKVFNEMFETGNNAEEIVKKEGLVQISDENKIKNIVAEVVSKNPKSVEDYKAGKDRALGFLVGQIMKETKGKANPKLVNKLLIEILNS